MITFKIIDDDTVLISEVGGSDSRGAKLSVTKHSFLIRGNIRIIRNVVTANSIEIVSNLSSRKDIDHLILSEDGQSWVDKRGGSATIQRFNEIVTSGRVLIVKE